MQPKIPPQALAAARAGQLVEAIKIVREETSLSLAEAKALVERELATGGHPGSGRFGARPAASTMPVGAVAALQRGHLIEAIRAYRDSNGTGLKDAKDAIDKYLETTPHIERQFREAARQRDAPARRILWILMILGLVGFLYVMLQEYFPGMLPLAPT
jgi:ribosomal protein L7/L12